jgi:hypothetical protein
MSRHLTLSHEELDQAYLDPFAGDDEAWAPDDIVEAWMRDAARGVAGHIGFYRALFRVITVSVLAWAALAALVFELYRDFVAS